MRFDHPDEVLATEQAKRTGMYCVYGTQGRTRGGMVRRSCATLEEALKYTDDHYGMAGFGIIYPNGEWHKWTT